MNKVRQQNKQPEKVPLCGTIHKVVRVPSFQELTGSYSSDSEGYGIVRTSQGSDVYFVDSAVSHGSFSELERGMSVSFVLEDGPLVRAAEIWVRGAGDTELGEPGAKSHNSPQASGQSSAQDPLQDATPLTPRHPASGPAATKGAAS